MVQRSRSGVVDTFDYNGYNELVTAVVNGITSTYTYFADGLRRTKSVGGIETKHIYDGEDIVMDLNSDYSTRYEYVRGLNLMGIYDGEDVVEYIQNSHGDVIDLFYEEIVITDYSYDAYGNHTATEIPFDPEPEAYPNPTAGSDNPFRYCGEYYDAETGFIYLRARYYDPSVGRFTTEDPIRDGTNWYVYCANNPVMFVDPSGTISVALAESFLQSPVGQQMSQYIANWAAQAGVTVTNYVVQNFPQIQQTANYISQYGVAAWDWTTNTAVPWVAEKAQQAGQAISDTAQKAGSWVKEKWNNATGGDPNNWKNGQSAEDVVNKANHVFDNPKHNLDGFLNKYSGNTVKAYKALTNAAQKYVNKNNITGTFEQAIKIKGYDVTIRGNVINGMARVTTAYIP